MEIKRFNLEIRQNPRAVRIIQVVFGIICILLAITWVFFNIKSMKNDGTVWITIVFLVCFGAYQVLAGFGKTERYFETGPEKLVIKQNSFLPKIELRSNDITKLEIFPLSIRFFLDNGKKMVFRFGLSNTDVINPVKDEIIAFAGLHSIALEEKKEEI